MKALLEVVHYPKLTKGAIGEIIDIQIIEETGEIPPLFYYSENKIQKQ